MKELRWPCNHNLKFLQKYPRFDEVIWKFELPLLSRADILAQKDSFDDVTWNFELALLPQGEFFAKIS